MNALLTFRAWLLTCSKAPRRALPKALFLVALSLWVFAAASGCSGCGDPIVVDQDMSSLSDAGDDLGGDAGDDLRVDPDLDGDLGPSGDMRAPKRDMPLSPFDFGSPDMPQGVLALEQVVPPSGPLSGGTLVRFKGIALGEGVQIYFSGRRVEVELVGDALLGRTPPSSQPGPVAVKAISPSGQVSLLQGGFTYVATLAVERVTPSRVPTSGGVELEIHGSGFEAPLAVSLGGRQALSAEIVTPQLLRVISPPHPIGPADLRVTSAFDSVVAEDAVTYFEPLALEAIEPASGPLQGGNLVTLKGRGFEAEMSVVIGGRVATVEQVMATAGEATARVPSSLAAGQADVQLIGSASVTLEQGAYLYVDAASPPQLGRVTPSLGSVEGGEAVRVTGHKLDQASLSFWFGAEQAQVLEVSSTFVTILTPAGSAPGEVDVSLNQGASELDRLEDAYAYIAALELTAASPATGPVEGGTQVILTGRGLDHVSRVELGGVRAAIESQSPERLTIVTPAHAAGLVTITARSSGGLERELPEAFEYTEPLEVWGFSPTRGALAGDTYVAVRGRGFRGALGATLGDIPAQLVRRIDANNLYLYTPPGGPGEVALRVTAQGAMSGVEAPYPYLYFNPASRFGGASGSSVEGAVNVTVIAGGGAPIEGAFVMLSTRPETRYQGLTDANGQVTLSGPDVLGAQIVTATAAGYTAVTVQSIDAENITVFLASSSPPSNGGGGGAGNPPPFGTIRGYLQNLTKLADPDDESSFDMALVATTSPSGGGGNPDPGPGSVVFDSGRYEITSRIGDLAVVALCGVFDEDTQSFTATYLAVARYLVVNDQGVYEVDLECDIPLDQTLDVKLINPSYAPDGPTANRARVVWDFGFEGTFQPAAIAEGLQSVLSLPGQPALIGALSDVTLDVSAGSFTEGFAPLSQTFVNGVEESNQLLTMPPLLAVPQPLSPMPQGTLINSQISWTASGPYLPDMYWVVLRDQMGLPVWTITLPGDEQSVTLPQFPDFSALPPAQRPDPIAPGQLFVSVTAIRIPSFRYEDFTYQDLTPSRWEAQAVNRWSVMFP